MTDQQTEKDTVSIVVDGKPVEANPGEMVIAAAERNGVYIPRFCYHPRMKPVGMCRMCLVDIKGPRGFALQPACFVPVADGQEIVTDSPRVKKAQDGVLEFLLINHPLDCPVCDKGGECPLQDQTLTFGPGETRFLEEKRHFEKPIPLSALVDIDRERCIQCARCTRFADEIAGDQLIDFKNRGGVLEVNTFPDEPFASYFSGNTVQICPVGALLARPYRFRARPWDLEQVESTCTACAVGCRVAVQSSSNQITRYIGIDSDPVNHGWLCDRGRFSYEYVNSRDRVCEPMVRKGDQLVEVSWGDALVAAAKGLKDVRSLHGSAAIGVLGGARLANEDAYVWSRVAKSVLGTDNVDAQLGDGLPAELVLGVPRATIDDACSAPAVILLGPDIKEELPVLYLRLRAAAMEGKTKLVELTPQPTGLSKYAAVTLGYRPGEVAVAARALLGDGDGDVAGIPAATLRQARELLADPGVVVVLGRPSVAESADTIAEAAHVIAGLTGVRFLTALRRGNVHGALDMGLAPGLLPGRVALDAGREWFTEAWGAAPEQSGLDAAGILAAAAEGRMQALVLLGADPLNDFPDRALARRGLAGAGFVVAVDIFRTESIEQADVVLPAATFAERAGTTTNIEGRISHLGQKVVAPGVAWPDWMIGVELSRRLGTEMPYETLEEIWDEIERVAPSHEGITRDVLRARGSRDGVLAPLVDGEVSDADVLAVDPMSFPGLDAPEKHRRTAPDETVRVATSPASAADENGDSPADADTAGAAAEGAEGADGEVSGAPEQPQRPTRPSTIGLPEPGEPRPAPQVDAYSLRLVSGRKLYDNATLVQRSPSLAGLAPDPCLRVNPHDLERLAIRAGGRVRVRSQRGSLEVDVEAHDDMPRGSASLAFNLPGTGPADLIDVAAPVTEVRIENV